VGPHSQPVAIQNNLVVAGMTNKRSISIAILAMGGQGGGTVSDWIVSVAERANYAAQLTSVPGGAQRTGATVYYIELYPDESESERQAPVMALMPVPGDVDIVIAGELIEAGRGDSEARHTGHNNIDRFHAPRLCADGKNAAWRGARRLGQGTLRLSQECPAVYWIRHGKSRCQNGQRHQFRAARCLVGCRRAPLLTRRV